MGLDLFFKKGISRPHYKKGKRGKQQTPQRTKSYVIHRYNIGCFYKVNALYNWIYENVSPFENCQEITIEREQLELLQGTLNKLDTSNCHELFPTCSGFFFGSKTMMKIIGVMSITLKLL